MGLLKSMKPMVVESLKKDKRWDLRGVIFMALQKASRDAQKSL